MSSYNFPEYRDNPLLERIVKLEKEVRQLRSRNPLNSATQNDADGVARILFGEHNNRYGITLMSEDGTRRIALIGTLRVDGASGRRSETGIGVYDENNQRLFLATAESGLMQPAQELNWRAVGAPRTNPDYITSTTWEAVWEATTMQASADAIETNVFLQAAAGTTCEFRMRLSVGGVDYFTSVTTLTAQAVQAVSLWQPVAGLTGRRWLIDIQARRVSGSGGAWVFTPASRLRSGFHLGATTAGPLTF